MTVQAEAAQGTNSSTELEPVAPGALARVKGDKPWTVLDLADLLAGPAREFTEADSAPEPPKDVKFTETLRKALNALPGLFGVVKTADPRILDRHELKALTDEANAIATLKSELDARTEAIKEAVRNHLDRTAEAAGLPEGAVRIAEGAAKGHWLLAAKGRPAEVAVDGYTDAWQQRLVQPKPTVDPQVLPELLRSGEIGRDEFLAFTREVRAYDADKAAAFIRKNPERGLRILARMAKRPAPSASLNAPKK